MVKRVNDEMLEARLQVSGITAVAFIDFTEKSSREFLVQFDDIRKAFHGLIQCYVIDTLENPSQKYEHKISASPTTILFRDGNELARYEAAYSYKLLRECINNDMKRK